MGFENGIREALHFSWCCLFNGASCEEKTSRRTAPMCSKVHPNQSCFKKFQNIQATIVNCHDILETTSSLEFAQTCWHVDVLQPFFHDSLLRAQCGWIAGIKISLKQNNAFVVFKEISQFNCRMRSEQFQVYPFWSVKIRKIPQTRGISFCP